MIVSIKGTSAIKNFTDESFMWWNLQQQQIISKGKTEPNV